MTWLLTRGRVPFLCGLLALTAFFALPRRAGPGRAEQRVAELARGPPDRASTSASRPASGATRICCSRWPTRTCSSADGLALLDSLTERIARIDGVRRVFSLSNAQQIVAGEAGAELAPVVAPPLDGSRARRAACGPRSTRNPELTGLFVSQDRRTAGLLIEIEDREGDFVYRAALIDALRAIIAEPRARGRLAASDRNRGPEARRERLHRARPAPADSAGGGGARAGAGQSSSATRLCVLLPLGVTGVTTAWTLGAYELAGFQLNAITGLLAAGPDGALARGERAPDPGLARRGGRFRRPRRAHPRRGAPAALPLLLLLADHGARLRVARDQQHAGRRSSSASSPPSAWCSPSASG